MTRLRILGLALVAVFAMGAVVASAAMASPEWLENGSPLTSKVAITSKGTLKLSDTGTPIGTVTVTCAGTDKGTIGPGAEDEVTEIKASSCTSSQCSGTPTAEAVNIAPTLAGGIWQTKLETVGTEIRDKITTTSGTKVVGWTVHCTILGKTETDTCTSASSSTKMTNNKTTGNVEAEFEAKSPKAKCTLSGGKETGGVSGVDIDEKPSGATSIEVT